MFTLSFDTNNAAFVDADDSEEEVVRILQSIASQVARLDGTRSGKVFDANGNSVGEWSWRQTRYVATVSAPGYLPDGEPEVFDSAEAAWNYLADQRREALEGDEDPTVTHLMDAAANGAHDGTVFGPTPEYDGDHDLGLAYSVTSYLA